jgi:hypothetical protein
LADLTIFRFRRSANLPFGRVQGWRKVQAGCIMGGWKTQGPLNASLRGA